MNMPGFTAEASLYRTSGRYRASASDFGGSPLSEPIVPAYFPGPGTQAACNTCLEGCAKNNAICSFLAMQPLWGCIFPPACPVAAAIAGSLLAGCQTTHLICSAGCVVPGPWTSCCPKVCSFPNPLEPGEGCCDEGENCVDRFDPNARHGCCPSDQSVCGGKCCAKGDSCCGDECCPAGWFCVDGFCSQSVSFPTGEPPPPPPSPPGPWYCLLGWEPCQVSPSRWVCCPPGKECCGSKGCQGTCVA